MYSPERDEPLWSAIPTSTEMTRNVYSYNLGDYVPVSTPAWFDAEDYLNHLIVCLREHAPEAFEGPECSPVEDTVENPVENPVQPAVAA